MQCVVMLLWQFDLLRHSPLAMALAFALFALPSPGSALKEVGDECDAVLEDPCDAAAHNESHLWLCDKVDTQLTVRVITNIAAAAASAAAAGGHRVRERFCRMVGRPRRAKSLSRMVRRFAHARAPRNLMSAMPMPLRAGPSCNASLSRCVSARPLMKPVPQLLIAVLLVGCSIHNKDGGGNGPVRGGELTRPVSSFRSSDLRDLAALALTVCAI